MNKCPDNIVVYFFLCISPFAFLQRSVQVTHFSQKYGAFLLRHSDVTEKVTAKIGLTVQDKPCVNTFHENLLSDKYRK